MVNFHYRQLVSARFDTCRARFNKYKNDNATVKTRYCAVVAKDSSGSWLGRARLEQYEIEHEQHVGLFSLPESGGKIAGADVR